MVRTPSEKTWRRRLPRPAFIAIAITLILCAATLLFRTQLRARLWAWQLVHAATPAQRSTFLAALCNAGPRAQWGTSALLDHEDPEVRQYGVLVLHYVKTPWTREQLLRCILDPDPNIRRLAAIGLASHGDDSVIPTLKWLYLTGDSPAARTACLAFERLGTSNAVQALNELALQPANPPRRAALIDAVAGLRTERGVPALLALLDDHRVSETPSRSEEMAQHALEGLLSQGYVVQPSSQPTTSAASLTIAERAAEALGQITGVQMPFSSTADAKEWHAAKRRWTRWYEERSHSEPP